MEVEIFQGESVEERKMLLRWWYRMWEHERDEFVRTFTPGQRTIPEFVHLFSPPNTLYYAVKENEIVFAVWTQPVMQGCSIGGWVAPGLRQTETRARLAKNAIAHIFSKYPIIITIARPTTGYRLDRMGFQHCGSVPGVLTGTPAIDLYWLDAEHFNGSILGKMEV